MTLQRRRWKFGFRPILVAMAFTTTTILIMNQDISLQEENGPSEVELLKKQVRIYELQLSEMTKKESMSNVLQSNYSAFMDVQSVLLGKTSNHVKEFWWYLRSQMEMKEYLQKRPEVAAFLRSHYWTMQREIVHFRDTNPTAVERVKQLGDEMAARLDQLQNPSDCSNARYVVCTAGPGCGFGCQLHYLVHCLIIAYANNRTLIVQDERWLSGGDADTSHYFKPVVLRQCHDFAVSRSDETLFSSQNLQSQILTLPMKISTIEQLPYLPQAVPDEVAHSLTAIHGHPSVWWIGQMTRYLLRPSEFLQKKIAETKLRLGFKKPIVGIHVRRGDKIDSEASLHAVDEYFSKAEEFHYYVNLTEQYHRLRVFLATDEATVYNDARSRYPSIDILYIGNGDALLDIVLDILLLAESDYLVCTFSSNVCRLAYEMMQSKYTDASWRFYSLDDIWYLSGQQHRRFVATIDHSPQNAVEIELKAGDELDVAGNEKNGYSVGTNKRTSRHGLFPSYKIEEVIISARFPRDED